MSNMDPAPLALHAASRRTFISGAAGLAALGAALTIRGVFYRRDAGQFGDSDGHDVTDQEHPPFHESDPPHIIGAKMAQAHMNEHHRKKGIAIQERVAKEQAAFLERNSDSAARTKS